MVSITSILLLASSSIAATTATSLPLEARAKSFQKKVLYAYGASPDAGIGGIPVTYGDGTAFIGNNPPSSVSVAANITFSHTGTSSPLGIQPNNSDVSFPSAQYFFINTEDGAFDSVQINASEPAGGYTDTGFLFYGNWLFWKSDAGDLQSKFYATPSDDSESVWTLKWNADDVEDGTSVPVSLRTMAPRDHK